MDETQDHPGRRKHSGFFQPIKHLSGRTSLFSTHIIINIKFEELGGLINPRPGRGQYRAVFSNTGGSPKPRKRALCQKSLRIIKGQDSKIFQKYDLFIRTSKV